MLALQSKILAARDLATGTEAWSRPLAVDRPMAADAGRLFVVAGHTLHAITVATGAEQWAVETGAPTAPVVALGGWVIVASGDTVTALRAADGEAVWTKPTGTISEAPAIDGSGLYLPLTDGRLLALDLKTGQKLWDRVIGPSPSAPLAAGDRVYLGSDSKRFVCLDAKTGVELWNWAVGTRLIGAAAADDARIYVVGMDNLLRALSRANGNQRWKYGLAYRPSRGPVVMGDQVSVPGITGELTGISTEKGKPTGKLTLTEKLAIDPAMVPPAEAGGTPMIVSMTGGLSLKWTLSGMVPPPPPAPPATPPPPKQN